MLGLIILAAFVQEPVVVTQEPEPVILNAQRQMELTTIITTLTKERDQAEKNSQFWYQKWREENKKKGVCI
jgi:hypothetical protein